MFLSNPMKIPIESPNDSVRNFTETRLVSIRDRILANTFRYNLCERRGYKSALRVDPTESSSKLDKKTIAHEHMDGTFFIVGAIGAPAGSLSFSLVFCHLPS